MYATVVIDIPDTKHKGFDYSIPEDLTSSVDIGSRVLVPLGSRTTQGFVIAIHESAEVDHPKPIKESLDLIPPLNEELIELGLWMKQYYFSHLYRTLQMLIPSALKTKIEEYISIEKVDGLFPSVEEEEIINYIASKQLVHRTTLLSAFPNQHQMIKQMIKLGILKINRDFKDKASMKMATYVTINLSREELLAHLSELSNQAKKQKLIMEYFLFEEVEEIEISRLLQKLEVSRSSIQALVKKGILAFDERVVYRNPYQDRVFQDKKVLLNNEQKDVLQKIIEAMKNKVSLPFLLHGVTGSGKTEIYLNAIDYAMESGRDAIVLVPEISLTPQMVERFKGRFGQRVAVLHSRLSQGEKLDEWRRIQQGDANIAIGARSAIFAPFNKLGLIIIDEEHESSYKQEEHPKYHVRDVAKWRAKYHQASIVLGSATPSIESFYNTREKEYQLLELPNRVMGSQLPVIELVDMREELENGNRSMFSHLLQEKISEKIERKEQIVLFLNRRGYSTFVMCRTCGYVMKCPHCEISLTYHHTNKVLRCHHCGYTVKEPKTCPECNSNHIRYFGTGTQKVEEELARRFPGVRVIRMDVDTTSTKGSHEKLLSAFRRHEADILLGTQMIAKGLDFPKVTLVGVIAADTILKLPDFRAAERTFQLLTQVSGRAGRHQLAGDVIIQTYSPEHYSLQHASKHDYLSFFSQELKHRSILNYPPYKKLIIVHFSHTELSKAMKASERFVRELKNDLLRDTEVLGPVTSPISRLKDRYRFQCMIKYNNESMIRNKLEHTIQFISDKIKDRQLLISIDRDPYILM